MGPLCEGSSEASSFAHTPAFDLRHHLPILKQNLSVSEQMNSGIPVHWRGELKLEESFSEKSKLWQQLARRMLIRDLSVQG